MGNRPPLSRDRLLTIALEAFEEGAQRQRAKREAAGLPLVSELAGGSFLTLGPIFRAMLAQIIRHDEDTSPPVQIGPADGGLYCPTCDGARFRVKRDLPGYSPPLVACPDCTAVTREATAREMLARLAGLSRAQRTKRFETFVPVKGATLAVSAAAQWASRWAVDPEQDDTPWLVISGERGSGKTHIGLAAANLMLEQLHPVRWHRTLDLADQARGLYADPRGEGAVLQFRRELAECPALVLDEFGALSTAGTDWSVSRFFEPLLDQRYADARPTLFTLKASPSEVRAHISDSIGRRMQDASVCLVVENEAPQWTGSKG